MADDVHRDLGARAPVVDLQTQLARAYLSGDGAEVERVLREITAADIALPPKTRAAA
jgi:hypothetical protein